MATRRSARVLSPVRLLLPDFTNTGRPLQASQCGLTPDPLTSCAPPATPLPHTALERCLTTSLHIEELFINSQPLFLLDSCVIQYISVFHIFFFFFETKSHYVAQAGLELKMILLPQLLRAGVTGPPHPARILSELVSHVSHPQGGWPD